ARWSRSRTWNSGWPKGEGEAIRTRAMAKKSSWLAAARRRASSWASASCAALSGSAMAAPFNQLIEWVFRTIAFSLLGVRIFHQLSRRTPASFWGRVFTLTFEARESFGMPFADQQPSPVPGRRIDYLKQLPTRAAQPQRSGQARRQEVELALVGLDALDS